MENPFKKRKSVSKDTAITPGTSTFDERWAKAEEEGIRAVVDETLAGLQAVREGAMDAFSILGPQGREPIVVDSQNVDEIEEKVRLAFSDRLPDLLEGRVK